jgi:hypothetical protein
MSTTVDKAFELLAARRTELAQLTAEMAAEMADLDAAMTALRPRTERANGHAPVVAKAAPVDPAKDSEPYTGLTLLEAAKRELATVPGALPLGELARRLQSAGVRREYALEAFRKNLGGVLLRAVKDRKGIVSPRTGVFGLNKKDVARDGGENSPSLTSTLVDVVRQHPGITANDLAGRLQGTSARNVIMTIIGQQIKKDRLKRDAEGRLFLPAATAGEKLGELFS